MTQQLLHGGHGEDVPTDAQGPELAAAAQDGQDGLDLGVRDPAMNYVEVLEAGCNSLQQSSEGLGTKISQGDATEIQVLELTEIWALRQMLQVRFRKQAVSYGEGLQGGLQAPGRDAEQLVLGNG